MKIDLRQADNSRFLGVNHPWPGSPWLSLSRFSISEHLVNTTLVLWGPKRPHNLF